MRRSVFFACAVVLLLLTWASSSEAASNLNLSKSNINVVVADPEVATAAQTTAMLAELDRLPPGADEAAVRKVVEKHVSGGVKGAVGKEPVIRVRRFADQKRRAVLILKSATDEEAALQKAGYDLKQNKGAARAPAGATK